MKINNYKEAFEANNNKASINMPLEPCGYG